jgi:hypothetical protein
MLDWIAQITTECDWTLRRLFDRYQLSPIYVLDILAFWKAHLVFYRRAIEGSKYLRSAKHREQHSKVLLKAAEILELWKPISSYTFSMLSFPEPRELRFIAKTLQGAGASQSHRPENIELKKCARDLSELFKRKTSLRLPEYVGELLRAAFPDMWNPASRVYLKEAAKQLLKGPNGRARQKLRPPVGTFVEEFNLKDRASATRLNSP